MNYKDLTELYPSFKIPIKEHSKYYVDTLIKAGVCENNILELWDDFTLTHTESIVDYKNKMFDELNSIFVKNNWVFNDEILNKYKSTLPEKNGTFEEDKFYVSVDLKEANWQSVKKVFEIQKEYPSWENWLIVLGYHPFLANSKTLRQVFLGRNSIKHAYIVQKYILGEIIKNLPSEIKQSIHSICADEIIFCFNYNPSVHSFFFNNLKQTSEYDIRITIFKTNYIESFGDKVCVKSYYDFAYKSEIIYKKLYKVKQRYFMHLKNIILNQPILEKDLMFTLEKHAAQWVV